MERQHYIISETEAPQCKLHLIFSETKEEPNFLPPLSLSVKYNDQIYTDTMELAKMSQWYTSYVMQVSHLKFQQ